MRRSLYHPLLAGLLGLIGCQAEPSEARDDDPRNAERPTGDSRISEYPGSLIEDRQGRLWISTAFDGLIRYDGHEFVAFTTSDGLPSNTVRNLLEDDDGVLWLATGGGLCSYDGTSFVVHDRYEGTPYPATFSPSGDHRDLWDVAFDSAGRLWICGLGGAFVQEEDTFVPFPLAALDAPHDHEFTPRMVYCVFEDHDGSLWFGTDGAGLVHVSDGNETVYTTANGLCSNYVSAILRDPHGDLWIGTSNGGVSRYDGEAFSTHLRNTEFSKHVGWGRFLSMHVDGDGAVWFGRSSPGGGAYRYDGREFEYLSTDRGLGPGGVIAVSEDRRGQIWLGTTSGLYRFDGERFHPLTRDAAR